jgi:DNA-directed RNA polymerase specialized sigma24 family protein
MRDDYRGTITRLLADLRDGDEQARKSALEQLWKTYFHRLLCLAEQGLTAKARRVADADDVLVSVFQTLYQRATRGDFPELNNRDEFLGILIRTTRDKSIDRNRKLGNQRHGGDMIPKDSLDEVSNILEVEDLFQLKVFYESIKDPTIQIVLLKRLMGFRNDEIAKELGIHESSVDRKVRKIRDLFVEYYGYSPRKDDANAGMND